MQTMDSYFERLYDENQPTYAMPLSNERDWDHWKQDWSQTLKEDLGGFPAQYQALEPRVEAEIEREEFVQQRVVYTGEEGMEIPAYLLIPKDAREQYQKDGKKTPAVVAVAGHGAGMLEICALTEEHQPREIGCGYQKDFAAALCQRGFVVLVPEMLGFGLRRFQEDVDQNPGKSSCFRMSMNLLMMGKTMAGVRVRDVMRSLDFLETLPYVDQEHMGAMGISGGGTTLMYAGALDERLKAVVLSGAGCTFRDSILKIFHCTDNFVPHVYSHGEMYDILGLMAPRALLLEAGDEDDIFPIAGVKTCYQQLKKAYRIMDAEEKLELDVFHGGHQIHGGRSYAFLQKWLAEAGNC